MRTICVIPARWDSTRFPGKPLANVGGKTLLERTHAIARSIFEPRDIWVATDDEDILQHVLASGGRATLTSSSHRNGTERCAEAANRLGLDHDDIVINLQGDACMTPSSYLWEMERFLTDREAPRDVVTVVQPVTNVVEQGIVYATCNRFGDALYFSRSRIPPGTQQLRHVGVYGYSVGALRLYAAASPGPYEQAEGLEQLRFLEQAIPMRCLRPGRLRDDIMEVNYPADVAEVERRMEWT